MPKLNISVPHHLTKTEAAERIKKVLGQVKAEQGQNVDNLSEDWQGNTCYFSFSIKGLGVSGIIEILADQMLIDGDLPFAAIFFKGKIEETIRSKATELLA